MFYDRSKVHPWIPLLPVSQILFNIILWVAKGKRNWRIFLSALRSSCRVRRKGLQFFLHLKCSPSCGFKVHPLHHKIDSIIIFFYWRCQSVSINWLGIVYAFETRTPGQGYVNSVLFTFKRSHFHSEMKILLNHGCKEVSSHLDGIPQGKKRIANLNPLELSLNYTIIWHLARLQCCIITWIQGESMTIPLCTQTRKSLGKTMWTPAHNRSTQISYKNIYNE